MFRQLIINATHSLTMLNTFTETWFTDQNNKPLDMEGNVSTMLSSG